MQNQDFQKNSEEFHQMLSFDEKYAEKLKLKTIPNIFIIFHDMQKLDFSNNAKMFFFFLKNCQNVLI